MTFNAHCRIPFDEAPFRLSGVVYGALLNQRGAVEALRDRMALPPYNAPPQAPVLFIKPRNTLACSGDNVSIPIVEGVVDVGASLGAVIGRVACRVALSRAMDYVAGYLIVNDVSVPHPDYYRPSIRCKARDGFCPLGPEVTPRRLIVNPDALPLRIYIDDVLVQTSNTATMVRSVAQLLADVSEFMTLSPGDILILGVAAPAPRVRIGQTVRIEIDGLATLTNVFTAEPA